MSVISSTPVQICNSPLNSSKSKMLYSFAKSKRLPDLQTSTCSQAFYDLPPIRENRSTGFGYGTKYDFTKSVTKVPAPNAYNPNESLSAMTKKKGISFGLSREAMQTTGAQFVGDKSSPGPGAYDTREVNKSKISFSFRPRTNAEGMATNLKTPGPGTYKPTETINEKGKYFVSKFKNSGASTFAPPRSQRWTSPKEGLSPGPGTYKVSEELTPTGNYFLSTHKSSLGKTFGGPVRKSESVSRLGNTPGPGSYRIPSDFGYYESSKAARSPSSSKK